MSQSHNSTISETQNHSIHLNFWSRRENYWREKIHIPTLARILIMNGCWTLSNAFSASIEMIIWFLTFVNVVYDVDWFAYPAPSLWTWDGIPLGHGVWYFLYVVGFGWLKICWEFLHLYWSKILAYSILFWWNLCLFLEWGWCWHHRMSLGVFILLQPFEKV